MRLVQTLRRLAIYALPLAFLLLAATAGIAARDLLGRLSLIAFDLYQRLSPRWATNSQVAVVDIDDRSLAAIGQWPWPRTIIAQLVEKLAKAGAAVVAFDIDFAEPDRTSPKMLLPLLFARRRRRPTGGGIARPTPMRGSPKRCARSPVVTGFIPSGRGGARPPAAKAGFAFAGDAPLGHVLGFPTVIADLPVLEAAAAGDGFLNQDVDRDHVVRRAPLILTSATAMVGAAAGTSLTAGTSRGRSTCTVRPRDASGYISPYSRADYRRRPLAL